MFIKYKMCVCIFATVLSEIFIDYEAMREMLSKTCIGLHLKISSPVTGLDRPRGFQEVKVPRFRDNGTGWW